MRTNSWMLCLFASPLLVPAMAQALTLGMPKIDSSVGEPLYAEIPFSQARSRLPVKVEIIDTKTLDANGDQQHLQSTETPYNVYVRQNDHGSGVVVVTSSTPMNAEKLDLFVRITDDEDTRIQALQGQLPTRIERLQADLYSTVLRPQFIADASSIAPKLPMNGELPLIVEKATPPTLNQPATLTASLVQLPQHLKTALVNLAAKTSTSLKPRASKEAVPLVAQSVIAAPPMATPVTSNTEVANNDTRPPLIQTYVNDTVPASPIDRVSQIAPLVIQITRSPVIADSSSTRSTLPGQSNQFASAPSNVQSSQTSSNHYKTPVRSSRVTTTTKITKKPVTPAPIHATQTRNKGTQSRLATRQHSGSGVRSAVKSNRSHIAAQRVVKTSSRGSSTVNSGLSARLQQQRTVTASLQRHVRQLDQNVKSRQQRIAQLNKQLAETEKKLKNRVKTNSSQTSLYRRTTVYATDAVLVVAFKAYPYTLIRHTFHIATPTVA